MLEELQLRNLSPKTAHTYIRSVERFARYFNQSPARLEAEHVREYLLHLIQDRKVVANTLLVNRAALKFLYVTVLKQKWFDEEIACPKRRPTLPGILSAEEITRILDHTRNLKHWTMLAMLYAPLCAATNCGISRSAISTANAWCCMCAMARVALRETSRCPPCCWNG
jgi:site-specific recombinase XerD